MSNTTFLPVSKTDMQERGWEQLDFLYISGDAYVDHPSFGHAIITRVLESAGYRVGIIAQPDWNNDEDFLIMGAPRLGILISSGVIDSMVNHYTAAKKKRSEDKYAPGGKSGMRPDRAVIVYSSKVKSLFKGIPVIIGGIEASLRRFAHYDFWQNEVRASILQDSKADLLIYGMGEKPILEIADLLNKGVTIDKIQNVRGTCYIAASNYLPQELHNLVESYENREKIKKEMNSNTEKSEDSKNIKHMLRGIIADFIKDKDNIIINTLREVKEDKAKYVASFYVQYSEQESIAGKRILQKHMSRYLVQNPPVAAMTEAELDAVYALPYVRAWHPQYNEAGGIPALEEVEFSIASQRGCFGACSFCALNFHQGRVIQSRSHESIVNEAKELTKKENFKGYINDVGGPTANFREVSCNKQEKHGMCKDKRCLFPQPCNNLEVSHKDYLSLLRKLKQIDGIKKVFIRSGIRYDYLIYDENQEFFNELCKDHISGQLKVAPEHISENVLKRMGKPGKRVYDRFTKKYFEINKRLGKNQFLVPYFISGHPGSTIDDAIELALYIKEMGYTPEQVQQFYPTPGTLSTCMYYTELDPLLGEKIYVAKSEREKSMQRALLQVSRPQNHSLVLSALKLAGRTDLIGMGKQFLVAPRVFKSMKKESESVGSMSSAKNSSNNRSKNSTKNSGKNGTKNSGKNGTKNSGKNGNKNSRKDWIKKR